MIRKKHITLCFSLFLALSMVLGQLIPIAATDTNTEVATTEEQMNEPETTAEEVPEPEEAGDETSNEENLTNNPEESEADSTEGDIENVEEAEINEVDINVLDGIPETVAAEEETGLVPVYVYVVAKDDQGKNFSDEMLSLLKVSEINKDGYFAAGTVMINPDKLSKNGNSSGKIKTEDDWTYIIQCLDNSFNPGNSIAHPANQIKTYLSSIKHDIAIRGSDPPRSGMWTADLGSNPNKDGVVGNKYIGGNVTEDGTENTRGSYCWHLDLRFECAKITYLYGNNGLTDDFHDLKEIGSKVFVEGAIMDYEPTIAIPQGYRIVGYYKDPDFQEEWSAKGQPITGMDNKVYVKVVPENDVAIHYVVKEGQGSVTDPSETSKTDQEGWDLFNPKLEQPESPEGSKAMPAADWEFEGWYSDADLTILASNQANFIPEEPNDGWDNTVEYTYYAKFVPKTKRIYVQNNITGNASDTDKTFTYYLIIKDANGDTVTKDIMLSSGEKLPYDSDHKAHVFYLSHRGSIETEPLPQFYSFTVTQADTSATGVHDDGYNTSLTTNCNNPSGSLSTNSHGHELNHTDLTEKERAEVVFVNEKSLTVPSGLDDHDSAIHGLTLSAGAGLLLVGAIIALRRRINAI